jgi:16S rRNA (guanine966-N2)-methyltransferase
MRVIAGLRGGTPLVAPTGTGTRPIGDRVKESLFGILGDLVADATVLDLYAGSGAIGIEALSRGARSVTFVERWQPAVVSIRTNLARTGFDELADIRATTVEAFLATGGDARFDLVFCDPPYEVRATLPIVTAAVDRLAPGGLFVGKHFWKNDFPPVPGATVIRTRRYGETGLTFIEREPA